MTSGAMAFYNNGPAYGGLYNWYAVDDARGLCPSGWHVPTDGEWTILTDHLGGESVAGRQMKTNYGWFNGGNGTNSSGFQVGRAATAASMDSSTTLDTTETWWSSSPDGSFAWFRYLYQTTRMSSATTAITDTAFLFVAFGMPSERSERVLNS